MFKNAQKPILENLVDLNLSYNLISNDCLRYLETISKFIKLRNLNLSGCNFNDSIFDSNSFIDLKFGDLEHLDVSYNELDKGSICKLISFLNFKHINALNFSNNRVTESGILKEISFNLQHTASNIRVLKLARCKVNDAEIWDFLRLLSNDYHLEHLDLAYNEDLTSVTLRRFIQHSHPPQNLNFEGCENILQYFAENEDSVWSFDKTFPTSSLKSLKVTVDYVGNSKKAELLERIWEQEWGTKAKIEKMCNCFMHLSVVD